MNYNYTRTIFQYIFIVSITCIIFYLINHRYDKFQLTIVILLFSIFKVIIFAASTFKKLLKITTDVKYLNFLIFVVFNIFYLIFSFSLDYFLIYHIDNTSFTGVETAKSFLEVYFKFFYLSFLLFTNMGVANVIPVAIPAEALVMFEAMASFATLIFILSDFVTLRDSLTNFRKENRQ